MASRTTTLDAATATRVAELEALLAAERAARELERAKSEALAVAYEHLKLAYDELRIKVALDRHRLTIAKAERIDTTQLELELGAKLAQLDELLRIGQGHRLGLVAHDLLHQQVEVVVGREGHHPEPFGELQGDLQGLGAD